MHYRSLAVNMSNKRVGDCISLETQTIILTSGLLNILWASRKGPPGGLATQVAFFGQNSDPYACDVSRRNRWWCLEKGRGEILHRLGVYFCLLCFSLNFSVVAWLVCKGHTVYAHKSLYLSATEQHRAHELCQFNSFSQDNPPSLLQTCFRALEKHKKASVHEPHYWKNQENLRQNYCMKQVKVRTRSFNLT